MQAVLIEGDGIGPEVTAAACRVVEAAGVRIDWVRAPAGLDAATRLGDPLPDDAIDALSQLRAELEGPLEAALSPLLTRREVTAVKRRTDRLLERRRYPEPSGDWPAVPWPPF